MSGAPHEPDATAQQPSLRRLAAALLGLAQDHIELFGIELQEQKVRTLQTLVLTAVALLLGLLLLIGLSALLLIALWDNYRLHAVIGLCLCYAVGLLLCCWRLLRRAQQDSSPFSATLAELARDRERLLP